MVRVNSFFHNCSTMETVKAQTTKSLYFLSGNVKSSCGFTSAGICPLPFPDRNSFSTHNYQSHTFQYIKDSLLHHIPLHSMSCVSLSICKISSLDKQFSTLKHFFSKSVYDNFKFSSSKRSGIVGILQLCDTNWLG